MYFRVQLKAMRTLQNIQNIWKIKKKTGAPVVVFVVSRLRNAKSVSSQVILETRQIGGVTFFI